jgi:hypothetical protein
MKATATIIAIQQPAPVKNLLSKREEQLVDLLSDILITKTLNDASKKLRALPKVQ